MKNITATFCVILLALCVGCGKSTQTQEIPLEKRTVVQYSYISDDQMFGRRTNNVHILVETSMLPGGILSISATNKGDDLARLYGDSFYQLDRADNTISAIEADLRVPQPDYPRMAVHEFGLEVGQTVTGYLNVRPGTAKIEYRESTAEGRKSMFVLKLTK